MAYEKELDAAKKAATMAARLCQNVQKTLLQSDVQAKMDHSPVTVADYGSQALISFVLQKELPSEPFSLMAEEDSEDLGKEGAREMLARITEFVNDTLAGDESYRDHALSARDVLGAIDGGKSEGGGSGRHWILDPIDGTKGFLRNDQYAIALALLDEGEVVLGVLACPSLPFSVPTNSDHNLSNPETGCLFSAKAGAGTHVQSLRCSSPVKVQVSAIDDLKQASFLESFEAAHSSHDLSKLIARKLGIKAPPVRMDSQAKYGALARGEGDIFLRLPHRGYREKIWDHAAGYLVMKEAGGVVVDAAGKALDFSRGRYLDVEGGIIATNPSLLPLLLKAVGESMEEEISPS